ncbi:hypothetical protein V2G26_020320 [Clonostachys chloroleuca]
MKDPTGNSKSDDRMDMSQIFRGRLGAVKASFPLIGPRSSAACRQFRKQVGGLNHPHQSSCSITSCPASGFYL